MASGAAVEEEMAADGDTEKAAEDPEAVASGAAVGEDMAADDDTEKAAEDPEEEKKFITSELCNKHARNICSRFAKTMGMQPLSPRGGGHVGHTVFGLCQARTYLSAQECSRDGATACFFLARSSTLVYT